MIRTCLLSVVLLCGLLACASSSDIRTLSEWRVKAESAYQGGRYAEALGYYQKLSKAVPAEAELWFRLGNTYARMNRTDDAIKAYREAMLRDPYFSKAWYNAALNQLRASSDTFLESLNYIPKNDPIYKLSESYYQKLLVLMDQQNTALSAIATPSKSKPLDVNAVEVIVLDGKAGGLPEDLTHEDLIEAALDPAAPAPSTASQPQPQPQPQPPQQQIENSPASQSVEDGNARSMAP